MKLVQRKPDARTPRWANLARSCAIALLCAAAIVGCGGASENNEVLGISVVQTSFGTTQIRALDGGINVALIETDRVGHNSIALVQEGEIIVSADITGDADVDLQVTDAGTYEVWAVTTGDAVASDDGIRLAPTQRIDRLGRVTLG